MDKTYYISDKLLFVRGLCEPKDIPVSSATHFDVRSRNDYMKKHPKCNFIRLKGVKQRYIITSPMRFLGESSIVDSMRSARTFRTVDEAVRFLAENADLYDELKNKFCGICVLDDSYAVIKAIIDADLVKSEPKLAEPEPELVDVKMAESVPCMGVKRRAISKNKKIQVINKTKTCEICGKEIADDDLSIDHIMPVSRGGSNDIENLRPVHKSCNLLKGSFTDDELISKVSDVAVGLAFSSPTSDFAVRFIRAVVRGTISGYAGLQEGR